MELPDQRDQPDLKEIQAIQGHKENKAFKVKQDHKGL